MYKDFITSLSFQNGGYFVGRFRSNGKTSWPILVKYALYRFLYSTVYI